MAGLNRRLRKDWPDDMTSEAGDELLAELGRRTTGFPADQIHQLSPAEQTALEAALPALETLASAPE